MSLGVWCSSITMFQGWVGFFLTCWSLSVFKLYRKKKGVALAVQTQEMSP